jgi:Flp pilus assembly protein TadD
MERNRILTAAVVLLALATATHVRAALYADEVMLLSDMVAKSPLKARIHNNLGHYLQDRGRIDEARAHFEKALELEPDYPDALNNLATLYINSGRRQEAVVLLQKCLQLNPAHVLARYNLAMQFYESNRIAESEQEFWYIVRYAPGSGEAAFAGQMLQMIRSGKRM